jgi:hypothetical protein
MGQRDMADFRVKWIPAGGGGSLPKDFGYPFVTKYGGMKAACALLSADPPVLDCWVEHNGLRVSDRRAIEDFWTSGYQEKI